MNFALEFYKVVRNFARGKEQQITPTAAFIMRSHPDLAVCPSCGEDQFSHHKDCVLAEEDE